MFCRKICVTLLVLASCASISSVAAEDPILLSQEDFVAGTYIIDQPGTYQLTEDISFNPNSAATLKRDAYSSSFPLLKQFLHQGGRYDPRAFGIGFFAAIVIQADGVTLDLNGYRLEQSAEHALMQRFFAVIELASAPFIPSQGPHTFGDTLTSATNTRIINGTIGRSSHHGIHGNGNENITIENVHFDGFEVAAVALNGVKGLTIRGSTAKSRLDVPVLGTFSSAIFLRHYLDDLVRLGATTTIKIGNGEELTVSQVRDQLRDVVNAVHEDVIIHGYGSINPQTHPEAYELFHNAKNIIDGNCYGYLVNAMGQAVNGFSNDQIIVEEDRSADILMEDVHVIQLHGNVREIVALKNDGDAVVDPIGAVFQIRNRHPDTNQLITVSDEEDSKAFYIGNVVANAQAIVAKAALDGGFEGSYLDLSRLRIDAEILSWIEADRATEEATLQHLVEAGGGYFCNADTMFHVNKGVIAFRIDASNSVNLLNASANDVTNFGDVCSGACGKYDKSHPMATLEGCGGPQARGFCLASSRDVHLQNCRVRGLTSRCGSAVGFDVLTDSHDVALSHCSVHNIYAGPDYHPSEGPQEEPMAIGFHIDSTTQDVSLESIEVNHLRTRYQAVVIHDESQ